MDGSAATHRFTSATKFYASTPVAVLANPASLSSKRRAAAVTFGLSRRAINEEGRLCAFVLVGTGHAGLHLRYTTIHKQFRSPGIREHDIESALLPPDLGEQAIQIASVRRVALDVASDRLDRRRQSKP
jgi:hypothetical protein